MGKQQKAKRILMCCTVDVWRLRCVCSWKQGKSWNMSGFHLPFAWRKRREHECEFYDQAFHEPKQEKPVLEILCILTSKKTPDSTLQPQCFKELNPLKQHCGPTGTQKLLCFTRALQLKFLHCWLSSDHKELWWWTPSQQWELLEKISHHAYSSPRGLENWCINTILLK